jgi:DNA-binding NarL/FixJ family response regulator
MNAANDAPSTPCPTVLVVDDDALFRFGVLTQLQQAKAPGQVPAWQVVGDVADGREALAWLAAHPLPSVVLMDVGMPNLDGIETTRRLKQQWPQAVVALLTSHAETSLFQSAFSVGAQAYMLKESPLAWLPTVLTQVAQGASWIDPALTPLLMRLLAHGEPVMGVREPLAHDDEGLPSPLQLLTPKEMAVLRGLCEGYNNAHLAEYLNVSLNTLKTHLKSIFMKLGVADRTEAVVWALKQGSG